MNIGNSTPEPSAGRASPPLTSRRNFTRFALAAPLLLAGGGVAGASFPIDRATTPEQAAAHLLNRLGFGPAPGEIDRVAALGPRAFIDEQLAPDAIPEAAALDQRLAALPEINLSAQQILEHYSQNAEMIDDPGDKGRFAGEKQAFAGDLVEARLSRAVESRRQLREVLTNFWFNHFNIGRGKPWVTLLFGNYDDQAIRPHVLGRFRDMLGATAHHPAMLLYLDNDKSHVDRSKAQAVSLTANVAPPGINENYARELMELHTLGVNGGYTQADVIALARILSGWRVHRRDATGAGRLGDFQFDDRAHDPGEKVFLGRRVGAAGEAEGEQALDILASHPSTARHIAFKLAQYFIADDPPPGVVDRLAGSFAQTGGDLRAVMRTLFESPEFWAPAIIGRKFKTPYEYVVSTLRATGAWNVDSAGADSGGVDYRHARQALVQMGMPVYGCVTPDGYKNTETAWLSAEALTARLSFAAWASGGVNDAASLGALEKTLRGVVGADTLNAAAGEQPRTAAALILGGPGFMRR
jgi:uncharacterized protein (DUF1800 family)